MLAGAVSLRRVSRLCPPSLALASGPRAAGAGAADSSPRGRAADPLPALKRATAVASSPVRPCVGLGSPCLACARVAFAPGDLVRHGGWPASSAALRARRWPRLTSLQLQCVVGGDAPRLGVFGLQGPAAEVRGAPHRVAVPGDRGGLWGGGVGRVLRLRAWGSPGARPVRPSVRHFVPATCWRIEWLSGLSRAELGPRLQFISDFSMLARRTRSN
jgi:hypothetical protein